MAKCYVISGNNTEFQNWKRDVTRNDENEVAFKYNVETWNDFQYVAKADYLRGLRDPHGVFIGSWIERDDIYDIIDILRTRTYYRNEALEEVFKKVLRSKSGRTDL